MKRSTNLLLLAALLAGCALGPGSPELSDEEVIGTLVAETQIAARLETAQPADPTAEEGTTPQPPPATNPPTHTPSVTPSFTPTLTSTFTPTITQTPTLAAGDPVLSLGVPTFDDRFDGGANFYLYGDSQSSYQIEDDRMVLIAKKANNYETWSMSWDELKNFYLEVTGTFGEDCGGKDRYGLIFRSPDNSQGYLLTIACDGSFRLRIWDSEEEEYIVLKKWTSSPHINTGPGGVNRLGIKAKNSKLTGYINGSQVFELNDGTFTKGKMGVVVAATDTPGFTAYLTRVVYWKLP